MSTTTTNSQSLTVWAQEHLAALYELQHTSKEDADLQTPFDSAFAQNAEVSLNHVLVPRENLKEEVSNRRSAAVNATIDWKDLMEVPASEGDKAHEVNWLAIRGFP